MREIWVRRYAIEIKDEHRVRAELARVDTPVQELMDAISQQWHVGDEKPLFLWETTNERGEAEPYRFWGDFNDGIGNAIFGPVEYTVNEIGFDLEEK